MILMFLRVCCFTILHLDDRRIWTNNNEMNMPTDILQCFFGDVHYSELILTTTCRNRNRCKFFLCSTVITGLCESIKTERIAWDDR